MTEFDKWYENIEKEYPLYQDKDGYNIGNIRALKVGWKAALEWAVNELKTNVNGFFEIEKALEVMRKEI